MSIVSLIISAVEFIFTCIKSFLLAKSSKRGRGRTAGIVFFVLESLCGIVLTVLLAIDAFMLNEPFKGFIYTGAILIVATEFASVVTEAKLIATRWKESAEHDSRHGYWRREILKWLIFAIAMAQVTWSIDQSRYLVLFRNTAIQMHSVIPLGLVLLSNVTIALHSFILSECLFSRVALSFVALGFWISFAFIVVFFGKVGYWPFFHYRSNNYGFPVHASAAVFAMAVSSAATAIAAWGLPNIGTEGISLAHVKVLEITSLGICGPTTVLGMSGISGSSSQVMLTVLPQVGALMIPVIFSYAKFLLNTSFRKNLSNKDPGQSESSLPDLEATSSADSV